MANPIAMGAIALGVLLLLFGIVLLFKRRKVVGIAISALGIGTAAIPFLVSFYLRISGL
jgi:hypothetical protein